MASRRAIVVGDLLFGEGDCGADIDADHGDAELETGESRAAPAQAGAQGAGMI